MRRVPDEKCFHLLTGERFCSLEELRSLLGEMGGLEWRHHVNAEKNDFAEWIEHALEEPAVAERFRQAHDPQTAIAILRDAAGEGDKPIPSEFERDDKESAAITDPDKFTTFHDAETERLDKVADKFDDFTKRLEQGLQPEYPTFDKHVAQMQEQYEAMKMAISDARKAAKDPFIAALLLKRIPSKLSYAKASKDEADLHKVGQLLEEVKKELNEELAREAINVKKEVEARTAKITDAQVATIKGNTNKDAVEVFAKE